MTAVCQSRVDSADPSSYRPISNLNTISKIVERLALSRILSHVDSSVNIDQFQSAYRCGYSTETALLKISSDIYDAADAQKSTILAVLDQSAAFDCIVHNTLITRLEHTFGFSGAVLS